MPLFPLSNVVLFPEARVPLHIFEQRYRQMMEAALEGDRAIGMVTVLPDRQDDMGENPPVFPIGCAGFIAAYQQLADGRYDLVLQGTRRFRILEEDPPDGSRLYRCATVELMGEPAGPPDPSLVRDRRRRVIDMLERLARRATAGDPVEIESDRLEQLDDATFTNALCAAIGLSPVEKQGLLEANGVSARLERLESVLQFHVVAIGTPAGDGTHSVH